MASEPGPRTRPRTRLQAEHETGSTTGRAATGSTWIHLPVIGAQLRGATVAGTAAAAAALASIPLSFTGPGVLRIAVIGPFLLAGPGTALILFLTPHRTTQGRRSRTLALDTAVALSFSLTAGILLSTAMLYARFWHPSAAVCVLSGLTLVLLAAAGRGFRRRRATP